jgi:hypothetical protein
MRFSHTVMTSAPPRRIWELWTNVEGWPEWDTELERARLDGPFAEGTAGEIKPRSGPASRFTLRDVGIGAGYAFHVALPLATLTVNRRMRTPPEGTEFTHEVSFTGPLGWLFGFLFGGRYRLVLPGVMDRLRARAEAAAPAIR